ncbi:MAG: hypothetical protein WC817_02060 [Patescibacteria group bacterium]|jgi:hypothetical protein
MIDEDREQEAIFFNEDNGQRLVSTRIKAAVCAPDFTYNPDQAACDYTAPWGRLSSTFEGESLLALGEAGFKCKSEALLAQIASTPSIANILKAVHLPIVIPQFDVSDYGRALKETFLPAVGRSYETRFPARKFCQNIEGDLIEQVSIVEGSRHERLVERMRGGPVVGIYFPNPLQGWSINAQREQMEDLYEGFLLTGGVDSSIGQVMYPAELARDRMTLLYDMAALQWRSGGSLFFGPRDSRISVSGRSYLELGYCDYSGGLLFVG